jgi:uncharacterized protein YkwD
MKIRIALVLAFVGLLMPCARATPVRAQAIFTEDKRAVLAQLNAFRAVNGIAPLAYDARLDDAAQRHANDMAARGFVDVTGSDGTNTLRRMIAANVPAYDGARPHVESVYAGQGGFDIALRFLSEDDGQRASMLNTRFRQVGIGIAGDGVRTYWSLVYGAIPGAFPFSINDGAATTTALNVVLRLSQEDAAPQGTADAPGRIVDVRVSESADFEKASWQPWQAQTPFVLARRAVSTTRTVNVEFRDARGLTARSQAVIVLDLSGQTLPPETSTPTPPAAATSAPSPTIQQQAIVAGPRPTATVITIGPLTLDPTASPTAMPTPAPTTAAAATVAGAASATGVSQSRIISGPSASAAESRPSAMFQPRDRGELPAWVWLIFAFAQGAAIIYALRRIFRR